MPAHGVTAGDHGAITRRLLVALAVAAAFAVTGAVVADIAASQADEPSLEREGHDLVVDLSTVDDPDEVVVDVAGSELRYAANATDAGESVAVDVTDPINGSVDDGSLSNATVTVTAAVPDENGTATETIADNESADLRYATFDRAVPAWIDDGDLRVPLDGDRTAGLDGNVTLVAHAGDESAELEATVRNDGSQLTVAREDLAAAVSPTEDLLLEVGTAETPITGAPLGLGPEFRSVDDDLVLWHPLLEPGDEYEVVAADDDGRYATTDEPIAPGALSLSSLSYGDALSVGVADATDDAFALALNASDDGADIEPFALEAVVVEDGQALEFERHVAGLGVDGALVESSDARHLAIDGAIDDDGSLALENATVSADDEVLLSTAAGVASVTLEEPQTAAETTEEGITLPALGDSPELGLLAVLPPLLGVGIGVIGSQFGGPATRKTLGLAGVAGFGFSLLTVALFAVLLAEPWPLDPTVHGLAGVGLLLGTAAAPGLYYLLGSSAAEGDTGFRAGVTVTDGDEKLAGRTRIRFEKVGDDGKSGSKTITNGTGQLPLPERGKWRLTAEHGSQTSDPVTVRKRSPEATLSVSFPVTLTVTDGTGRDPIPGATVRSEDGTTETTDADGTVTLEPSDDGSSTEVEVDHEKYQSRTETVTFGQNGDRRIELRPRTGGVRVVSRVDGVPTESMSVRVRPAERFLSRRSEGVRATTGRDGVATRDDLLIGQYRAELSTPAAAFEGGETSLTVREGRTATVEVDARFTWSLSSAQRRRIEEIRRDVRALSDHSGRDTSVPEYYGSVVESMLETVESMPDAGHHFVGSDADPDGVATAILETAARTTDAINDAMTTKRNVDLFAACADMPDARVRWRGEYDLAELLTRLESDPTTQRNELKERYEAVAERIESHRQEVAETAPAGEMHQRAWELVGDTDRGKEAIVIAYTSLLVLDAVEQLFEHDALYERLSRTVF